MILERKQGGMDICVKTTVKDMVVIVLMNSDAQLHASAGEEETQQHGQAGKQG